MCLTVFIIISIIKNVPLFISYYNITCIIYHYILLIYIMILTHNVLSTTNPAVFSIILGVYQIHTHVSKANDHFTILWASSKLVILCWYKENWIILGKNNPFNINKRKIN